MKKFICMMLVSLMLIFSLAGCGCRNDKPIETIDEPAVSTPEPDDGSLKLNEDGYLILPATKKLVKDSKCREYFDLLTKELVAAAEDKIETELMSYSKDAETYYFTVDEEGYLCLAAKILDRLPEGETMEGGADHAYIYLSERVTEAPME